MRINMQTRVAALAAAALALAACSSSSTKASSSTTAAASSSTTAAASSGVSGAAVTVGEICSCTGVQAANFALVNTVAGAWAKWTNARGGLNGHPVNLIIKDDGGDPATAQSDIKEMVTQNHVVAVLDDSLADSSWASYVQQQGVPVVGGVVFETPFLSNPDFFASGGSTLSPIFASLTYAAQAGTKNLGVLYCAESPVCQQAVGTFQVSEGAVGSTLVTKALSVSATAPSYTSQCLTLQGEGAGLIYPVLNSPTIQRFVDQCTVLGYKPVVAIGSPSLSRNLLTDPNLNGALISGDHANYVDASVPGVKDFLSMLDQYAPSVKSSPAFSYDTLYPFAGGQLLAAAFKAGNLTATATPDDVKRGLYALKGETLGGLAPPLTFTPGQPSVINCHFDLVIKSGQLVTVGNGVPVCLSSSEQAALLAGLAKAHG